MAASEDEIFQRAVVEVLNAIYEVDFAGDWVEEVFGHAELGDSRRTRRLVRIAAEAAARPGGRVLEVCRSSATRQGAYEFLSNRKIAPGAVQAAVTKATTLSCEGEEYCFVVVDGTALTFTDWKREKDFGANTGQAHFSVNSGGSADRAKSVRIVNDAR